MKNPEIFEFFYERRKINTDAIAMMSLDNFHEMSSSVGEAKFLAAITAGTWVFTFLYGNVVVCLVGAHTHNFFPEHKRIPFSTKLSFMNIEHVCPHREGHKVDEK